MSIAMVFQKPNGGRLGVADAALDVMLSYRQQRPTDTEAGGVLIGRFIRDSDDVIVDIATQPMPGDRRRRTSFYRSKRAHQEAINEAWRTSNGTHTYLGEWHTHPEPNPSPSMTDLQDWRKRIQRDTFHGDTLHFLIVGQNEVGAWEMHGGLYLPYFRPQAIRMQRTPEGED